MPIWILLNVGFLSILAQVVLLRELSVASYGIELIYLLALGVWLLAGACGAMVGRWPRQLSTRAVASTLAAFGIVLPASVVMVRAARLVLAPVPGAYVPFPQQVLVLVFALGPVSILLGVLFQWAARLYIGQGRTLAIAYGIESVGGLIGGLAGTVGFKWGAQNFAVAIGCGLAALVAPIIEPAWRGSRVARYTLAVTVTAGAAVLLWAPGVDRRMTAWNHPGLVETRDSAYGRVTIARAEGQLSAFDNDALWFDTEGTAAETFTHVVLLQHPNPARVLLLGGGVEGVAAHALAHAPRAVDYVELNQQMYEMIGRYLPDETRRSLAARNLHVIFNDPRRFLQQGERYDAILVAMSEPASGAANRFYTREFFTASARMLNPGGILGFRLQSSENFWTPLLTRRMVSIYRAIRSVFPYVSVLPGATNIFVSSFSPLPASETVLEHRLNARQIHATVVSGPYLRYLYTNDRRAEIARALDSGAAPENTDVQPICYEYAAVMWLSKFFPRLAEVEWPAAGAPSWATTEWIVGISLLALFVVSRVSLWWRRVLLVAVAGFAGMVLETILILHFQMKNGIVFQDIGMLLTAFMAGLAGGALGFSWLKTSRCGSRTIPRWWGAALLGGVVAVSLCVGRAAAVGGAGGLGEVMILLGVTGALVAALFAYISVQPARDPAGLVSPLYAADLLGGCAGSLLGSLVLIPMAGLALSARAMAVVSALSLVLL